MDIAFTDKFVEPGTYICSNDKYVKVLKTKKVAEGHFVHKIEETGITYPIVIRRCRCGGEAKLTKYTNEDYNCLETYSFEIGSEDVGEWWYCWVQCYKCGASAKEMTCILEALIEWNKM